MAETPIATILIIDDDDHIGKMLTMVIHEMGHRAVHRKTLQDGLAAAALGCDVVLLDVGLPDGNGLEALAAIQQTPSEPDVIIITGYGDKKGAEMAVRSGVWDYIQKSDSYQKVILTLKRVLQYRQRCVKRDSVAVALNLNGLIGNSKVMKQCYEALAGAAVSPANILICGETGTGKEVFARVIHENSRRVNGNLVVVDCAALPETLVESLLFGHEKGSFTGADKSRQGLIAQADGGTLFLDEVGELPLSIQKVFLRVLQERRFRPVGGRQEIKSDFRLISATNRDLDEMVVKGVFRRDLLYRIRTMQMVLPPLRERTSDIKTLALHYIDKICERVGVGNKGISPDFIEPMYRYPWPGNVRELINTLETVISSNTFEPTLYARHLPERLRVHAITSELTAAASGKKKISVQHEHETVNDLPSLKDYRKQAAARAEKEYLRRLIAATGNHMKAAQDISGLSRSRFYELIKQHGLVLSQEDR